jgi:Flp pilus assembly pilin Flp
MRYLMMAVSRPLPWRDRRGVTALEYGILGGIIAAALFTFFADPLGGFLPVFFNDVVATVRNAAAI